MTLTLYLNQLNLQMFLLFSISGHCATNLGVKERVQLLQGHAQPLQRRRQIVADQLVRKRHLGSNRQRR